MSSRRSSIYSGSAKAKTFSSALQSVDLTLMANKETVQSAMDHAEEERMLAIQRGEKLGFERGHAKGFIEGYEEGKGIGILESKTECQQATVALLNDFSAALKVVMGRLQDEIGVWFEESEQKMTDLALQAIRKILIAELSISRESALEIVKDALGDVTHSRHARIKVNPFDSLILKDHRLELLAAAGSLRDIEFVNDPSIQGGCIIETDGGVVDATIETKLILLQEELPAAA